MPRRPLAIALVAALLAFGLAWPVVRWCVGVSRAQAEFRATAARLEHRVRTAELMIRERDNQDLIPPRVDVFASRREAR